jgi:RsiW-degrading membrane proteinase PrsW (M82 family)
VDSKASSVRTEKATATDPSNSEPIEGTAQMNTPKAAKPVKPVRPALRTWQKLTIAGTFYFVAALALIPVGHGQASILMLWIIAGIGAFILYWLPAIIASRRKVPDIGPVVVLNFFGFTSVLWIVALVLAMRDRKPAAPQFPPMPPAPYGYIPAPAPPVQPAAPVERSQFPPSSF